MSTRRRSISVRKLTHARVYAHCEAVGISCSSFLEGLIKEDLDRRGVPEATEPAPTRPKGAAASCSQEA